MNRILSTSQISTFSIYILMTCSKSQGQEEQLFRNLAKKYNLDPSVFGIPSTPAIAAFGTPPPGIAGTPLAFGQPTPLGGATAFGMTSSPGATAFGGAMSMSAGSSTGTFGQSFSTASNAVASPFGSQSFGSLAQTPHSGFGALASQAPPSSAGFGGFGSAPTAPQTTQFGSPFGAARR